MNNRVFPFIEKLIVDKNYTHKLQVSVKRGGGGLSVRRSILICSNLKEIFGRGNFISLKLKTEDFVYL